VSGRAWLKHLETLALASPASPIVKVSEKVTTRREFFDSVARLCLSLEDAEPNKVSIVGGQNASTYAAIFACLCTETNYNPIPANTPAPKIEMYLDGFRPDLVLCDEEGSEAISETDSEIRVLQLADLTVSVENTGKSQLSRRTHGNQVAYTMFTSGTTGKPKGVQVSAVGVEELVSWLLGFVPVGPRIRVAQLAAIGFDLSFAEIIFGILSGGCLLPFPAGTSRAFPARFVRDSGITHLFAVPSLIQLMSREFNSARGRNAGLPELEFCLTIGEPLLASQARFLFDVSPQVSVVNAYGPTEATVLCSIFPIASARVLDGYTDGEVVPIGAPFGSNRFEIEASDSRGVGELVICGPQVALGYLDVSQTRKSFVFDENGLISGYRSGDLVRLGDDGLYRFHGRVDRQVKVGGTRVELGEIETAVREFLAGESAITFLDGKLACHTDNQEILNTRFQLDVIKSVRGAIGKSFSPSKFFFIPELPKTSSGKIDYRALEKLAQQEGPR